MSTKVGAPKLKSKGKSNSKKRSRTTDVSAVEQGLEDARDEERATGSTFASKSNADLFVVDTQGDSDLQRPVPRPKKLLKSQQILAQRSAHPPVFSQISHSLPTAGGKKPLTKEQKDRLRRIARKEVQGPLGTVVDPDPSRWGDGSALFNGVQGGLEYDAWVASAEGDASVTRDEWDAVSDEWARVQAGRVRVPKTLADRRMPDVPAVVLPETGQSYNPTAEAHQALLDRAIAVEVARAKEEEEMRAVKERMIQARKDEREESGPSAEVVFGMTVDLPGEDEQEEEGQGEAEAGEDKEVSKKGKTPARKTKQQRRKAEKAAAEAALRLHQLKQKRQQHHLATLPSVSKQLKTASAKSEAGIAARAEAREARLRAGLAGVKVGKNVVALGGEHDVQLGEELAESWRTVKPEGNLFKDRFTSMQHRALVEPRKPIAGKRRSLKIKSYEKHAWKRFE